MYRAREVINTIYVTKTGFELQKNFCIITQYAGCEVNVFHAITMDV